MPRSLVGAIRRQLGLGFLEALDERPPVIRYECQRPSKLIRVGNKILAYIHGVAHRITGDRRSQINNGGIDWEYLNVAINDASRLAYTEKLVDEEQKATCASLRGPSLGPYATASPSRAR